MLISRARRYYLRELGTEGQGSAAYPDRKPYSNIAAYIPLGVGYKYNLNPKMNIGIEIVYRFTTPIIWMMSVKPMLGIDKFPKLPDRLRGWLPCRTDLMKPGHPNRDQGRQRGYSNQNDGYLNAEIMFSFNITSYRCPY